MMKFKKVLAAAMTGAMMLGIAAAAPAASTYAAVASSTVSYADYTVTIELAASSADQYIILEVLKDEDGDRVSATYMYPVGGIGEEGEGADKKDINGAVIDLSFLKGTKEQYIRVYGDTQTAENGTIITITPQTSKLSIKYKTGNGTDLYERFTTFRVGKSTVSLQSNNDLAEYEYRTLYGSSYADLNDFAYDTAEIAGTTIVIRKKAVEENTTNKISGAAASPEVKVKISALAKAPKLSIDYVKGEVKLPKGAEYQVIETGAGFTKRGWISVGNKALSLTPSEILSNCGYKDQVGSEGDDDYVAGTTPSLSTKLAGEFKLLLRTAATENKAASNVTMFTIPAAAAVSNDAPNAKVTFGSAECAYEATEDGYKLTATDSDFSYSVDRGKSWKTIKAGNKVEVSMEDGDSIWIKGAGNKNNKVLPSLNYVTLTWTKPTAN